MRFCSSSGFHPCTTNTSSAYPSSVQKTCASEMFRPISKSAVETRESIRGRFRPEMAISYTGMRLLRPLPSLLPSSRCWRLKLLPNVGARSFRDPIEPTSLEASMSTMLELLASPRAGELSRIPRASHTTDTGLDCAASNSCICCLRSSRL